MVKTILFFVLYKTFLIKLFVFFEILECSTNKITFFISSDLFYTILQTSILFYILPILSIFFYTNSSNLKKRRGSQKYSQQIWRQWAGHFNLNNLYSGTLRGKSGTGSDWQAPGHLRDGILTTRKFVGCARGHQLLESSANSLILI